MPDLKRMSSGERFRNDSRRLDFPEEYGLNQKRLAGTITDTEMSRLQAHFDACTDDAMRRNVVPDNPDSLAALRDPSGAEHHMRSRILASGMIDWTADKGWHRTDLGNRVFDLIERDARS